MVDLEQLRASHAFGRIGPLSTKEELRDGLLGLARRLPEMLQINGLLATWAFLQTKQEREPARKQLEAALSAHLRDEALGLTEVVAKLDGVFSPAGGDGSTLSGEELRRLSAEAVIYAGWLKRAAEARCATAAEEVAP